MVNAGVAAGNLPTGESFLGPPGEDAKILETATAFEQLHQ